MSGSEPLTLTLEEALRRLHEDDVWLEPSKAGDGWVVYFWNDVTDQIEIHGDGATWPETVSAALGVRVVARDEAAELRAALAEMSDLVFTVLSAEEELGRINVTAEDYPEQDYRAIRDEALVELATLARKHDDRAALAASERQP